MVRILQFSDLHFRHALPGHSGHAERLSRQGHVLLDLFAQQIAHERPDLVAFTGDIADVPFDLLHGTGDRNLRDALFSALEADYRHLRDWLNALGVPWMIAPGNHDYAPVFEMVFGETPRSLSFDNVNVHSFFDWEITENTAERVEGERARFQAILKHSQEASCTVHLQHFLIWPDVTHGYPMRYREADQMRDALVASEGRHLVLSGHFHEGTDAIRLGRTTFASCPAIVEPPHRYRIIEVTPDDCRIEDRKLRSGLFDGRKLLLVDRAEFITQPCNDNVAQFALRSDAQDLFKAAGRAGFSPVLLSIWNDSLSDSLGWTEIIKKHDRLFYLLQSSGGDMGAAMLIVIDETRDLPPSLPSEEIGKIADVLPVASRKFGVSPEAIWLLSTCNALMQQFSPERVFENRETFDRLGSQESAP